MPAIPPLASDVDIPGLSDPNARIAAASAAVRRYCGWHIAPVIEQTVTMDGSGGTIQVLPTLRLLNVLEFSQNGVAANVATLEWSQDGYMRGCFTSKLRGVVAKISHGFDTPDLAQLVCEIAGRAQVMPMAVNREQAGSVSVSYREPGLMQHEMDQLAMYKLPRGA